MQAQLLDLVYPGFLRETPGAILPELPRYLRAMAQRAERVRLDPQRDQARLLELRPFLDALAAANTAGIGGDPRWQALRWNIEELRVSRSEEHTSELQSLMRISYAAFCLKK